MTTDTEITIKVMPEQLVMSKLCVATLAELPHTFSESIPEVWNYVTDHGGQLDGRPFARYYELTPERVVVEIGFPVVAHLDGDDTIVPELLPGGEIAFLPVYGPYHKLRESYAKIHEWLKLNGRRTAGQEWEVYITDPGEEPDQDKWLIEIYCPLK